MGNSTCVVMGVGQLGTLFSKGASETGYRVVPIRRGDDASTVCNGLAEDTPIILSVREADMDAAIMSLPESRREDVILVQNELFPSRWKQVVAEPTVAVVWTAAKPGIPLLVGKDTVVYGKHASWFSEIHKGIGLRARVAEDMDALETELAAKYAFILTINALGLIRDVTVGELFTTEREETRKVTRIALALAKRKLGRSFSKEDAQASIRKASAGLATMNARGRSAPARLERALKDAHSYDLEAPYLEAISTQVNVS